jgi:hypothetical protein
MDIDELVERKKDRKITKVVSVEPLEGYKLKVKLSNGRKGIFDVSQFLGEGVFQELRDTNYFNRVYIDFGTVVWPHEQDIDPELIEMELQPEPVSNKSPKSGVKNRK